MSLNSKRGLFLGFFAALAAGSPAVSPSGLLADTIRLQTGEEVRGEIRKETMKDVTIAVGGGGARSLTRQQIAPDGITHDNVPPELRDAREALEAREFERAHRGFQAVIAECEEALGAVEKANGQKAEKAEKAKKKALIKPAANLLVRTIFYQHALYGEARAYAEEKKTAEGIEAMNKLLDRVPDTWHLLEALLLKVRLVSERGKAEELATAVEDARKRAAGAGAGEEISDRITLIRAEQLFREKKSQEAQKLYKEIERSPVVEVADAAKLGLGEIQLAAGDVVQARMAFNGLLRESDRSENRTILCRAHQGLGDIQMKEGKTPESLREALESYLRAAHVYFPAEGDPTEHHQAALLSAAQCAGELMALSKKDPKAVDGYRGLARDNYQDVIRYYPRTEAAQKAAAALRNLSGGAR